MPAMVLSTVLAPVIAAIAVRLGTVAEAEAEAGAGAEAEAEFDVCCGCCFGCLVRLRPIGLVMERPVAEFAPFDGLVGWRGGDCGDASLDARSAWRRSASSTMAFLVMAFFTMDFWVLAFFIGPAAAWPVAAPWQHPGGWPRHRSRPGPAGPSSGSGRSRVLHACATATTEVVHVGPWTNHDVWLDLAR